MIKPHVVLAPRFYYLAVCAMSVWLAFVLPMHSVSAHRSDQNTSYVRVIHASPFVSTADVFVDGQTLLTAFQFAAVSGYVPVPAGVHTVQISLLGKGLNAPLITEKLSVSPGVAYTVAALGATPNTLSLQVFEDNNQIAGDHAKVRVYQLAPNAGATNVNVGNDYTLNNLAYPQASNYLTEDVGPCTFTVYNPTYSSSLPLTTNLAANSVTSVFEVGLFNDSPRIQLVTAQAPGIPGLPSTGSDPSPVDNGYPLISGLLAVLIFTLIEGAIVYYRKRRRI